MSAFTQYWTNVSWSLNNKNEGQPLDHSAGNSFSKRGVRREDKVYVVTVLRGKLFLAGRMIVDRITTQSQAQQVLGTTNLWRANEHILSDHGTISHFKRKVAEGIVRRLQFGDGKPLVFKKAGVLDQQTLRGVRRLTPQSADLLDQLLNTP